MVEHPPAAGSRTRRTMKRMLLVFVAVLAFASLQANTDNCNEGIAQPTPSLERIQAAGSPLVSGYIVDFIMSGNYKIAYKEPNKKQIYIYCNEATFIALCKDYDMMQELALNVKWGITSYSDYCTMEAKFEKKYTYAKNSKNVYWLTMSN